MGLAIIVPSISFEDANLGKVTFSGNVPVKNLYINLEGSYFGTEIDLKCSYSPVNTVQRDVIWSIESGSEYASIDGSTLSILPGASLSYVTIKCTSVSNPSVAAEKTIKVTYGEMVWRDFTEDMIVDARSIDSNTGQIIANSPTTRQVLLLPFPPAATILHIKSINGNTGEVMSFIGVTSLSNVPVDATQVFNWDSTPGSIKSCTIQSADKAAVLWQRINDRIVGIGRKQYAFE